MKMEKNNDNNVNRNRISLSPHSNTPSYKTNENSIKEKASTSKIILEYPNPEYEKYRKLTKANAKDFWGDKLIDWGRWLIPDRVILRVILIPLLGIGVILIFIGKMNKFHAEYLFSKYNF